MLKSIEDLRHLQSLGEKKIEFTMVKAGKIVAVTFTYANNDELTANVNCKTAMDFTKELMLEG